MLRLTWLALCRRGLDAARREWDEAHRDYRARVRSSRRATERLEDACRRYDASGIARVRHETADAHARVHPAHGRMVRARALVDEWTAEVLSSAKEVATLERAGAIDPVDAERARLGLPPSPR